MKGSKVLVILVILALVVVGIYYVMSSGDQAPADDVMEDEQGETMQDGDEMMDEGDQMMDEGDSMEEGSQQ